MPDPPQEAAAASTEAAAMPTGGAAAAAALVAEGTRRAGVVWLRVVGSDQPATAAWHVWHQGCAYLVTGGLEQPLPDLSSATEVLVTVPSKDTGGRLLTWVAHVTSLQPGSQQWDEVVPMLQAKRLNAPDGAAAPARWAAENQLLRLAPTGEVVESPAHPPAGRLAAAPPPTAATSMVPLPFTLARRFGRLPRRRPGRSRREG